MDTSTPPVVYVLVLAMVGVIGYVGFTKLKGKSILGTGVIGGRAQVTQPTTTRAVRHAGSKKPKSTLFGWDV